MATMNDVSMYLENIEEYVIDQNVIVTFKWLSLTLDIPCNLSKRLLQSFILSKEDSETKLTVMYLVIGSCLNKDGVTETKVCVVPGNKLSAHEASLDTVTLKQVYSVSAAGEANKETETATALYTQDYDITKRNLAKVASISAIKCEEAKLRSSADIEKIRKQGTYRPDSPKDTRHAPDPRSIPYKASEKTAPADKKGKTSGDKTSAKKSISGMFANAAAKKPKTEVKTEVKSESDAVESKPKTDAKPKSTGKENKSGKSNIGGFFAKGLSARQQMDKDAEKQKAEEAEKKKAADEWDEEGELKDILSSPEASPRMFSPSPKKTDKSPAKKVNKRKGKAPKTCNGKKASRLVMMDSSSEEDCSASEAEEEVEEVTSVPEEDETAKDSPKKMAVESSEDEEEPRVVSGKRKKRKEVEKTFLDEEGYMVCKKEWVDVTDSEEELPPPDSLKRGRSPSPRDASPVSSPRKPPSKQAKKASPAKKVAKKAAACPVKKKQASIMSFFKKK